MIPLEGLLLLQTHINVCLSFFSYMQNKLILKSWTSKLFDQPFFDVQYFKEGINDKKDFLQ